MRPVVIGLETDRTCGSRRPTKPVITVKAEVVKCLEAIGKLPITESRKTIIEHRLPVSDTLYGLLIVNALLPAFALSHNVDRSSRGEDDPVLTY